MLSAVLRNLSTILTQKTGSWTLVWLTVGYHNRWCIGQPMRLEKAAMVRDHIRWYAI